MLAATAMLAVGACGTSTGGPTSSTAGPSSPVARTPTSAPEPSAGTDRAEPVPIQHIHAVARDPATDEVILATHAGLFRRADGELTAHGPVVDLMSYVIAPDGTYLASGHPGAGVDLPEPVGLISSRDRGRTWTGVSRGGESDFHALAASRDAVIGFDGALRVSTDRRSWSTVDIPAAPRTLAAAPTSGVVLATTEKGLLASGDEGATWQDVEVPGLLVAATWADDRTIVGADTSGRLVLSRDAGATWTTGPRGIGAVTELGAAVSDGGSVEVLAVVGTSVLRTVDLGATTTSLL